MLFRSLPISCVEFFSRQNSYTRERNDPNLHLASVGVGKGLKPAVDGPRREIVIYKASVAERVFLSIDIPFLVDEGCVIRRPVIGACGHRVPDARSMIGANGQLHRAPSGFGAFGVVYRGK